MRIDKFKKHVEHTNASTGNDAKALQEHTNASTVKEPAGADDYSQHVVDIKKRLKVNVLHVDASAVDNAGSDESASAEIPPNPESKKSSGTAEEAPEQEESATFEDFEQKMNDKLNDTDAVELAEMIVSIGNIGRLFFLPGIYEGLMFPGEERNDIRDIVRRTNANEKENKPADEGLNNYEKRLFAKWPKLRQATENVSYTEPEIKTLAKYLARQIGEMTVSVWMHKYMWVLYILYLESTHAKNIIGGRANDFFHKKFGGV